MAKSILSLILLSSSLSAMHSHFIAKEAENIVTPIIAEAAAEAITICLKEEEKKIEKSKCFSLKACFAHHKRKHPSKKKG